MIEIENIINIIKVVGTILQPYLLLQCFIMSSIFGYIIFESRPTNNSILKNNKINRRNRIYIFIISIFFITYLTTGFILIISSILGYAILNLFSKNKVNIPTYIIIGLLSSVIVGNLHLIQYYEKFQGNPPPHYDAIGKGIVTLIFMFVGHWVGIIGSIVGKNKFFIKKIVNKKIFCFFLTLFLCFSINENSFGWGFLTHIILNKKAYEEATITEPDLEKNLFKIAGMSPDIISAWVANPFNLDPNKHRYDYGHNLIDKNSLKPLDVNTDSQLQGILLFGIKMIKAYDLKRYDNPYGLPKRFNLINNLNPQCTKYIKKDGTVEIISEGLMKDLVEIIIGSPFIKEAMLFFLPMVIMSLVFSLLFSLLFVSMLRYSLRTRNFFLGFINSLIGTTVSAEIYFIYILFRERGNEYFYLVIPPFIGYFFVSLVISTIISNCFLYCYCKKKHEK